MLLGVSDVRPGLLTTLTKIPARLRARGPREVGSLALGRAKEAIRSDDRLIFFVRAAGGRPVDSPKWEGLTFKRAEQADAAAYARDIGTDSAVTFTERLTDGTRCYLVAEGDKLLHATWVTTTASWVREVARYFRPPDGHAYVYESFTRADARGRGIYPFALHGISRELAADRIERVWVAVEAHNAPSLRAIDKAGFEMSFELAYKRRLGRLTLLPLSGPGADECSGCFVRKLPG